MEHGRTQADWWKSAVIYQVYPRSFQDSDNDGVGDLRGVLRRIDYIASLGVDAVWISPFYRSPMRDFGYDISDYCAVDPLFGDLEDFKALLSACHRLGIRVIIDQVWNHTSEQHPWFEESRSSRVNAKADWYVWADPRSDGSPPNNWRSTFGGSAWTWEPRRGQYYLHNFLAEQPDLNWYNEAVAHAVLECAEFWLRLGVDGFRLDVINFLTHDRRLRDNPLRPAGTPRPAGAAAGDPFFDQINRYNLCQDSTLHLLPRIRDLVERYGAITLAEVSSAEDTLAASAEYVQGRQRLHMAYNAALMTDEALTATRLRALIERARTLFGEGIICWTGGTHDFPRLTSRWRRFQPPEQFLQEAFDHQFAALLLTLPGSCCIYQGDELGLTQAEIPHELMQDPFGIQGYPQVAGRDGSRTPMPWDHDHPACGFTEADTSWLPIPEDHRPRAISRQISDSGSLLQHYQRLIRWRKDQPALHAGTTRILPTQGDLLAFSRESPHQRLLCLFNLGATPVYQDMRAMPGARGLAGPGFVDRCHGDTLEIPPFGVFIAELDGRAPARLDPHADAQ